MASDLPNFNPEVLSFSLVTEVRKYIIVVFRRMLHYIRVSVCVRVFVCTCARACFKASAYHCTSVNDFGAKPAFLLSELIPKFKPPVAMVGCLFYCSYCITSLL